MRLAFQKILACCIFKRRHPHQANPSQWRAVLTMPVSRCHRTTSSLLSWSHWVQALPQCARSYENVSVHTKLVKRLVQWHYFLCPTQGNCTAYSFGRCIKLPVLRKNKSLNPPYNKKSEYSYGDDWDALHDGGKGLLTILEGAFSRDQKQKIYVQDKLSLHKQTIYDWIVKNNGVHCQELASWLVIPPRLLTPTGYYLLCGPSGPPCTASRAAIVDAIATHGAADGFDKQKAAQYVTDMQLSWRFNKEVW